jgi:hypothetical protein
MDFGFVLRCRATLRLDVSLYIWRLTALTCRGCTDFCGWRWRGYVRGGSGCIMTPRMAGRCHVGGLDDFRVVGLERETKEYYETKCRVYFQSVL